MLLFFTSRHIQTFFFFKVTHYKTHRDLRKSSQASRSSPHVPSSAEDAHHMTSSACHLIKAQPQTFSADAENARARTP